MSCAALENWLKSRGIGSYRQTPNKLVISNENPATPGSNCFWALFKDDEWYIGTFLPAVYFVPQKDHIAAVCQAVFGSSKTALYTVGKDVVDTFKLRQLTDEEIDDLKA